MKLDGRGVIITGANRGLGKAIAGKCIEEGAHVMLCARDRKLLKETVRDLQERAKPGQIVAARRGDVSSERDVNALFRAAEHELPDLSALVNNAGIHGPKGSIEQVDWREWTKAVETNLFGTVLCCRAALRLFKRQGRGSIVNLSGGGATKPFPFVSAYAATKSAIVRLTETFAGEVKGTAITVNALAPGALNTRLLDDILSAGPEAVGVEAYASAEKQLESGGASIERAAACCVHLLSGQSGVTGRLVSAVWDPWENLSDFADQMEETDIYTLRRIVPEDRGRSWSGQ